MTERQEPQEPQEPQEREVTARKATLSREVHKNMALLGALLGALAFSHTLPLNPTAFLSAHALMWLNLTLIIRGVEGLLTRNKTMGGLLIVQLFALLISAPLLISAFKGSLGSLLVGASVWLVALIYGALQERR